jgi:vitamin K-dependent gamma-carboxylase
VGGSSGFRPGWNQYWCRFKARLALPVNGSSLAVFRIAVGLIMALEAYSLFQPNRAAIAAGTSPLETYYTGADVTFHLPYEGFEWVPLLPPKFIYAIVGLMALGGVMMALGAFYRVAAAVVFLAWGYLFVVESTRTYWQSHYYLELLVTFLMIWMPAARRYSVDAWIGRGRNAIITVPFWTIFLLRGQLVITYFYAGVAKLTKDWLLDAVPVRWFLREPHVAAPYERFLSAAQFEAFKGFLESPGFAYFLSYTGVVFDLTVGIFLLFRRTRPFALACMILFHALNHFLIFDDIGWFPLLGIATALIFLDPNWPERFRRRLNSLPANARDKVKQPDSLSTWVAPFVVVWLAFQFVIPLRHFFIPGDGRFTYEGMSFSWRLKSEMRHAYAHQLFLRDPAIVATDAAGVTRIHWNEWRGDPVIYREITLGKIDWRNLPEIVVVLEPMSGERIVFNPIAAGIENVAEARERVMQIWQKVYGRPPFFMARPVPLPQVLESIAKALREGGAIAEATQMANLVPLAGKLADPAVAPAEGSRAQELIEGTLAGIQSRDTNGQLAVFMRRLPPFLLEGEAHSDKPFLIVEDKPLFVEGPGFRIARNLWKQPELVRPQHSRLQNLGGDPVIIYTSAPGPEARHMLPQCSVWDHQDHPERAPYIWWNSVRDLSVSKLLHLSNQAFYLRRYARRVAGRWEKEYGRRPIVNAATSMSLNGRPHQPLVEPAADLATVEARWFRHNLWIRDLETPRIPRAALDRGWVGTALP